MAKVSRNASACHDWLNNVIWLHIHFSKLTETIIGLGPYKVSEVIDC